MNKLEKAKRAIKLARAKVAQDIKTIESAEAYLRKVAQVNGLALHDPEEDATIVLTDVESEDKFKSKWKKLKARAKLNPKASALLSYVDSNPDVNVVVSPSELASLDSYEEYREMTFKEYVLYLGEYYSHLASPDDSDYL